MDWRRSGLVFLALTFVCLSIFAQDNPGQSSSPATSLLLNSAQDDAIVALATDPVNGYLFSASADGSVNVYAAGKDLVQHIQVATNPLLKLAASTDGKIAVVEKLPDSRFKLTVWNWLTGQQLWNTSFSDQTQSLTFSPRNSFVVLNLARWNSLNFLESGSGKALPWLQNGMGIIDYALISGKETRLLSYRSTSGIIGYHDLATGKEIQLYKTKSNLRWFQIIPDQTSSKACAYDGNKVVTIDLQSGAIIDGKDPGFAVTQIVCDEADPNRILVFGGAATSLQQLSLAYNPKTGGLSLANSDTINVKTGISCLASLKGQLFAGERSGLVLQCLGKDKIRPLAEHALAKISSMGFSEGNLYLSTANGLVRVQSELFNSQAKAALAIERPKAKPIAGVGSKMGIANLSAKDLILWDRGKNPKIYRFDTRQDSISRSSNAASSSLVRVKVQGEQIITVDAIGIVRTLDPQDFRTLFSHSAIGAMSADVLNKNELLVGKVKGGNLETALLRINQKTGETAAIASDDSAIFLTRTDAKANAIYYVASVPVSGVQSTLIKKLQTSQPNSPAKTILQFPGEDLEADIAVSPSTDIAYTSAGGSLVNAWNDQTVWSLEDNSRMPRELKIWGNLLLAINTDGGLTVWDTESRRIMLDLFVLNSGNVFFITRNGNYGIVGKLGANRSAAEEKQDQSLVESLLSLPIRWRDKARTIAPVQYPCALLP